MAYKILVVDDDEHTHVIIKSILKDEFELIHAKDGQEAIDILSKEPVNLILTDIHMPGISGLEFLQSLMVDLNKQDIPVLIMTNLPSVEKEQKALNLGAADFINKVRLINDKEGVKKQVRMKLVSTVEVPVLDDDLMDKKNDITAEVMAAAIKNMFDRTAAVLCDTLASYFNVDYAAFWSVLNGAKENIASAGTVQPEVDNEVDLFSEKGFKTLEETRAPYLTNHIYNDGTGFFQSFSKENNLPAEIGIPLYRIDERTLLMNNMNIPDNADLFGIIILKRNRLFSTKEYELISNLVMQFGSILWRLHPKEE